MKQDFIDWFLSNLEELNELYKTLEKPYTVKTMSLKKRRAQRAVRKIQRFKFKKQAHFEQGFMGAAVSSMK